MNKKKENLKIEFDRQNIKRVLRWFGIFFIGLMIVTIFNEIMFPILSNGFQLFISLVKLYPLLSIEGKFFGGFVFLFIGFKIFETFVIVLINFTKWMVKLMNEEKHE